MRVALYLFGVLLCLAVTGCNGEKPKDPQKIVSSAGSFPAPAEKAPREVGKVNASETVSGSSSTYAYYLPQGYAQDKPAPVILFFDSHARGKDPVTRYQMLADQYDMVLIGSNNSRNGQQMDQSLSWYDELIRDVKAKFAVDEGRITACGFSGGARVAAMIAQHRPAVKSVIACSAGFQPRQNDTFSYYAVVGLEDFNYQELRQLERVLDQGSQPHVVSYWDGGHEWPQPGVMGDAFELVFLRTLPEDDPRKDSLVSGVLRRFDLAKNAGGASSIAKWRAYKQLVAKLDGLADISAHQAEIEKIIASKAWAADQALEEKAAMDESALREAYVPQIGTKRVEDWRKMAHQLRTAHGENPSPQHQMDLRVLNFLSLNVYFQVDGALKAGNLPHAEHFLQIYAIIDPANPEHAYLTAVLRMRQGRQADALAALQAAQRLGFKDADRMATDPEFAGLQGQPLFSELVEQMRTAG